MPPLCSDIVVPTVSWFAAVLAATVPAAASTRLVWLCCREPIYQPLHGLKSLRRQIRRRGMCVVSHAFDSPVHGVLFVVAIVLEIHRARNQLHAQRKLHPLFHAYVHHPLFLARCQFEQELFACSFDLAVVFSRAAQTAPWATFRTRARHLDTLQLRYRIVARRSSYIDCPLWFALGTCIRCRHPLARDGLNLLPAVRHGSRRVQPLMLNAKRI